MYSMYREDFHEAAKKDMSLGQQDIAGRGTRTVYTGNMGCMFPVKGTQRAVEREYFPKVLSVVTQETEQSMPSIEEG